MGDRFRDEMMELGIERAVDNIYGLRFLNIAKHFNSWIGGPYPNRCSVYLEMAKTPNFKEYHFLKERYLVSYDKDTGAVDALEYQRGSTRGFAGRTITLPVVGRGKDFKNKGTTKISFKGSVWDTADADQAAADYFGISTHSVACSEFGKNGCGISIDIDRRVFAM